MTNIYRVWNHDKTDHFDTEDYQLAYETRKGAASNLYDANGYFSRPALDFLERNDYCDCTIETIPATEKVNDL